MTKAHWKRAFPSGQQDRFLRSPRILATTALSYHRDDVRHRPSDPCFPDVTITFGQWQWFDTLEELYGYLRWMWFPFYRDQACVAASVRAEADVVIAAAARLAKTDTAAAVAALEAGLPLPLRPDRLFTSLPEAVAWALGGQPPGAVEGRAFTRRRTTKAQREALIADATSDPVGRSDALRAALIGACDGFDRLPRRWR